VSQDDCLLYRSVRVMCAYAAWLQTSHAHLAANVLDNAEKVLWRRARLFSAASPFRSQQPLGPN
jgi:hypothetical protein